MITRKSSAISVSQSGKAESFRKVSIELISFSILLICKSALVELCDARPDTPLFASNASINSKREHPRATLGVLHLLAARGLYHLNCPGVARGSDLLSIIKIPSCQLMPHEGTFQLQTDLQSIAAL